MKNNKNKIILLLTSVLILTSCRKDSLMSGGVAYSILNNSDVINEIVSNYINNTDNKNISWTNKPKSNELYNNNPNYYLDLLSNTNYNIFVQLKLKRLIFMIIMNFMVIKKLV